MANVYRRGTKSVHIGTRRSPELDPEQQIGCNLDKGGGWLDSQPPGPICTDCFGSDLVQRGSRRRRMPVGPAGATRAAVAATTAVVLGAAVVLAASLDTPVNYFPTPAPSESPVTPGPSTSPSEAPVFTPAPTLAPSPVPTFVVPTLPPFPTYPPVPTWPPFPPLPTFGPLPTLPVVDPPDPPDPTLPPVLCEHPGQHRGVDACKWPGNR